jgi:SAM-dependent methyltransferase
MPRKPYSREFFAECAAAAASSARQIVPLVLSLVQAQSVIDVGCGTGAWAAEFLASGVSDVWGVDGDYVNCSQLQISIDRFMVRDLLDPIRISRTFDIAVCLEVAEHLPKSRAASFVSDLTLLSPCVLFSAAVPGQGGTRHLNEQYLPYWVDLFKRNGYEGIDPIRSQILGIDSVQWYYQQNIVIFVASRHRLLANNFPKPQTIIHQSLYEKAMNPTLGALVRAFPSAALRSIRFRLGPR